MLKKQIWNYILNISEKSDWDSILFRDNIWLFYNNQVHWNKIILIEKINNYIFENWKNKADGIVTNIKNKKIWVFLADCNGIVVMWKDYFGIVHSGRKWLFAWILWDVIKTITDKWEKIKHLKIFIWPSIRSCCYEVWDEFLNYFDKKYLLTFDSKFKLDMIWFILDYLLWIWILISNIEISQICTYCNDWFFSFRKWDLKNRFLISVEKI